MSKALANLIAFLLLAVVFATLVQGIERTHRAGYERFLETATQQSDANVRSSR